MVNNPKLKFYKVIINKKNTFILKIFKKKRLTQFIIKNILY